MHQTKARRVSERTLSVKSVFHQRLHFRLVDIVELVRRMGLFDDIDDLFGQCFVVRLEIFLQFRFQIVVVFELTCFLLLEVMKRFADVGFNLMFGVHGLVVLVEKSGDRENDFVSVALQILSCAFGDQRRGASFTVAIDDVDRCDILLAGVGRLRQNE